VLARQIQKKRFESCPEINCNAQMSPSHVKEFCPLEEEGINLFKKAYERFKYSARAFHKFIKLSRTLADLEGSPAIRRQDVAAALMSRDIDREHAGLMVIR